MRNLSKKLGLLLCLCFIGVALIGCKNKEEEIENLLTDARYALSEGEYDDARGYYNQVLEIDSENRDAIYELKDLEKSAANRDTYLIDSVHSAIVTVIMGPEISESDVPLSGDYTLEEYLNKCPALVKQTVLECCGVKSLTEISEKLVSTNQEGKRINGSEIRVQIQSYNSFSVYVPDSYDIRNDHVIFGGVLPE